MRPTERERVSRCGSYRARNREVAVVRFIASLKGPVAGRRSAGRVRYPKQRTIAFLAAAGVAKFEKPRSRIRMKTEPNVHTYRPLGIAMRSDRNTLTIGIVPKPTACDAAAVLTARVN